MDEVCRFRTLRVGRLGAWTMREAAAYRLLSNGGARLRAGVPAHPLDTISLESIQFETCRIMGWILPPRPSHTIYKELNRAGLIRMERRGKQVFCWVEVATLQDLSALFTGPLGAL